METENNTNDVEIKKDTGGRVGPMIGSIIIILLLIIGGIYFWNSIINQKIQREAEAKLQQDLQNLTEQSEAILERLESSLPQAE